MAGCTSGRGRLARAFAAALMLDVCALGANKVTAVRFWTIGDVTRVAVEVSGEFEYKFERLSNPPRLFFDIHGARPEMVRRGIHTIPVGDTQLKQIRVAETQIEVTRVVLDLAGEAEFTASQLSNPERLMIELRSRTAGNISAAPAAPGSPRVFQPPVQAAKLDTSASKAEPLASPPPLSASSRLAKPPSGPPAVSYPKVAPPPAASSSSLTATAKITPAAPPPEPAKRLANGARSMTRVLGLKLGRVVLDPGHGGHDVGTNSRSGLYEKDLVLDIAKRLGGLIEENLGAEVVFTRSDDTFIPLEERTRIANDQKADLFLSIHANSSPVRSISGVETYYLNFTTDKAALDVAARENASSNRSVFDLQDLLKKIALKDKLDESREFASRIQQSVYVLSAKANSSARNRGVKRAPFVVLIGAQMPSVLAEIGFLSNPQEETLMKKPEHRQKVAEALLRGITSYASGLSRTQVAKGE